MSNHKEHDVKRKNEHLLKSLPTEVLLKARSTLVSLGGALKPRHDQQRKQSKQETKSKKNQERLKNSRSEPEFGDIRKKHRSKVDDASREYVGVRPRPLSVGATKRYEDGLDYKCGSFTKDVPLHRQYDSTEEVCVQSRLVLPVLDKLGQDVQMQEIIERPRKKLSFREPEIIGCGTATLGRSNKLMGVNSLSRRPNRISLRSSLECLDSDLESQAMRIVRTVGQAFEVCHKMQVSSPDHPAPSTSSAVDEPVPSCSDAPASKVPASECGASESAGSSKAGEDKPVRPNHLDLLPPPPRKENLRRQLTPMPIINLPGMPDLPDLSADLPECITKVDVTAIDGDVETLSSQHQVQLLRERLEQQAQQTRAAVAQLLLLRDQLAAEQSARCEAQARTHQLLQHNKELLEHIATLIGRLRDRETPGSPRPISAQQLTMLPQLSSSAKIDRWFSLLPTTPALSRPESGFVSGVEEVTDAATLTEAKNLLLQLGVKKKRRILPLRFKKRVLVNKHTML